MSKILSTTLVVIAVVALAGGLFFFGTMVGRSNGFGFAPGTSPQLNNNAYGPGQMMRGQGWNNGEDFGPGMMGRQSGYGMQRGYGYTDTALAPLTVEQAKAAAAKYLATLNNSDLAIAEVMIFNNNAYVVVKETSTGTGAFELLVDPASQIAYPEHGPNMMWNTKYGNLNHAGMMSGRGYGMMSGGWAGQSVAPADPSIPMSVSSDQAVETAQTYLDANVPGTVAASDPMQFYGYYTLDFTKDGKVTGMLSVNGYTGQVFLHTWHGTFIEETN